ncbi:MAG: SusD/RagB family nutrient-binding outer membrane lipoprotein, partial [Polaribacter sp.]
MMKNIYKIKVLIVSILLITACTGDFEEINIDENLPTEANSGTLLPSIIFDATNSHLNVQLYLTNQIMQYKVYRNENKLDAYDFASGANLFGTFWGAAYKTIKDSNEAITYAEENGLNAYVGAGKIISAFYLASLTEMWIDVPYSQSGLGLDNGQPSYDEQQTIYNSLLTLLEEANTLLSNDTQGFILEGDILFNGDVMKWRKMANSLRLRYLLRLSNRGTINASSQINTIVSNPSMYPIINSNDEAAIYNYTGIAPNTSDFSLLTAFGGLSPSERFVETLDGVDPNDDADDDPRLAFFAEKPIDPSVSSGPYVGVKSGTTREEAQGTGGN